MTQRPEKTGSAEPLSFEQALARLEETVQQLEEGRLGLKESLACYERGIGYLKLCYESLEQVEQRIELLTGVRADGTAQTQPFYDGELDEERMTLEQKKQLRSRRRSHNSGKTPRQSAPDDIDMAGGLF